MGADDPAIELIREGRVRVDGLEFSIEAPGSIEVRPESEHAFRSEKTAQHRFREARPRAEALFARYGGMAELADSRALEWTIVGPIAGALVPLCSRKAGEPGIRWLHREY